MNLINKKPLFLSQKIYYLIFSFTFYDKSVEITYLDLRIVKYFDEAVIKPLGIYVCINDFFREVRLIARYILTLLLRWTHFLNF